jgi:hypothetical protein
MVEWVERIKQSYEQKLAELDTLLKQGAESECLVRYDNLAATPADVQEVFRLLDEDPDRSPVIYKLKVDEKNTHTVRTFTDGDDGLIIVFDQDGKVLASGRTCVSTIQWATPDIIDCSNRNFLTKLWFEVYQGDWRKGSQYLDPEGG